MITISLCMIVKNEEDNIGRCLDSVKDVVDEIVIVDTGSTDKTKEVVGRYTDKIYDFEWIDDFAAARNYSFSKATKDYILWLDADDILLEKDSNELKKLKESLASDVLCVSFYYDYAFDDQGTPTLVFQRERLVKRSCNFQWQGFIHEYIATFGKKQTIDIHVTHCRNHNAADRNLNIFEKKKKEGVPFNSRDQYYYGKELFYHDKTEEAIEALEKFITMDNWVEDRLDAVYRLSECYSSKQEYKKARDYLFKCFEWTVPRAESLYRIGKLFQQQDQYEQAIYWYELIFHTKRPVTAGFIYDEFWTWKPHLELCVCYFRMGELEKSIQHNEEAAKYVPNSEEVKYNREFFKQLKE